MLLWLLKEEKEVKLNLLERGGRRPRLAGEVRGEFDTERGCVSKSRPRCARASICTHACMCA